MCTARIKEQFMNETNLLPRKAAHQNSALLLMAHFLLAFNNNEENEGHSRKRHVAFKKVFYSYRERNLCEKNDSCLMSLTSEISSFS